MTDIARIGASFDTSELKSGAADIRALVPVAKQAEAATAALGNAAQKMAAGQAKGASAAAQMAEAVQKEASALKAATGAQDAAGASATRAAAGVKALGTALEGVAAKAAGMDRARKGVQGLGAAIEASGKSMKLTAREGLNFSRQFADIGVTAAMGMNPFMIAMQQGPQLFDIFQEKAIQTQTTVGTVFKSMTKPLAPFAVALGIVIGLLALVGATGALWLQGEKSALAYEKAVSGVGRTANLTAGQLRDLTVAGAEQGNISIKAAQEQATAYLATGRIGGEVISGLLAIGKDYASFMGTDLKSATQELATSFADPAKAAVDLTRKFGLLDQEQIKQIKSAMAAGNQLKAQKILLDALTGAVSGHAEQVGGITSAWDAVSRAISNAITKLGEFLYMSKDEEIAQREAALRNPLVGVIPGVRARREQELTDLKFQRGYDNARRENAARRAAGNQNAQTAVDNAVKTPKGASGGKSDAEKFSDITGGADRDIAELKAKIAGVNLSADAAARLENRQKLLNEAQSKGITLSTEQRASLMGLADSMSDLQVRLKNLEGFKEINDGANRNIATLNQQYEAIGKYGFELSYLQTKQELLNQADAKGVTLSQTQLALLNAKAIKTAQLTAEIQRQTYMTNAFDTTGAKLAQSKQELSYLGMNAEAVIRLRNQNELLNAATASKIKLTSDDIAALKLYASQQSEVEIQIKRTTAALDFAKGATRGFVGDLMSGLQQGKSLWESFGNAVINVLNKVLDKMLDAAVEGLFNQGASNGAAGGGGGWLNTALSFAAKALGHAKGGAFDGAQRFAAGSAFSNTVVSSPTLFSFAKGTKLGEMGEAGPEAIMPLTRGPDGSLGVSAHGGGGSSIYAPVQVDNHYTITGAISSKDVVELTKQSAEQTKQQVRRELNGWLQQYNNDGAVV